MVFVLHSMLSKIWHDKLGWSAITQYYKNGTIYINWIILWLEGLGNTRISTDYAQKSPRHRIQQGLCGQSLGRVLGIIGQTPSVSKFNMLHVMIFQFFFENLTCIYYSTTISCSILIISVIMLHTHLSSWMCYTKRITMEETPNTSWHIRGPTHPLFSVG